MDPSGVAVSAALVVTVTGRHSRESRKCGSALSDYGRSRPQRNLLPDALTEQRWGPQRRRGGRRSPRDPHESPGPHTACSTGVRNSRAAICGSDRVAGLLTSSAGTSTPRSRPQARMNGVAAVHGFAMQVSSARRCLGRSSAVNAGFARQSSSRTFARRPNSSSFADGEPAVCGPVHAVGCVWRELIGSITRRRCRG